MAMLFDRHNVPVPAEQEFANIHRILDQLDQREQRLRQRIAAVPGEFKSIATTFTKELDASQLEDLDALLLMGG